MRFTMGRTSRAFWPVAMAAVLAGLLGASTGRAAGTRPEAGEEGRRPQQAVPTDVQALIREHFRAHLPFGWFITDPVRFLGGYEINLKVPELWRGNPAGQASLLCPNRRSAIWEQTSRLVIRPVYKNLPWAPFECRRGQA